MAIPPPRARSVRRALAIVAVVLAVVLMLELGVRLIGYPAPKPRTYPGEHAPRPNEHFVADPHLGWRMKPGTTLAFATEGRTQSYHADARGFRRGARELGGARTLAVLGDSFAWGAGVAFEETLAFRVAPALGWRVANFGQPGFGVDQIAETLRRCALPERPDLVIVLVYSQDFQRSLDAFRAVEGWPKPAYRLDGDSLVALTPADRPSAVWRWLDAHSWAFTAAKLASWRLAMRWPHGEWWDLNRAFVERMIDDCDAADTPIAVVHVPTTSWRAFPSLARLCERRGVRCLDPAADDPPVERIYYEQDKHLNAAGHAWFAQRICAWLRDASVVDL